MSFRKMFILSIVSAALLFNHAFAQDTIKKDVKDAAKEIKEVPKNVKEAAKEVTKDTKEGAKEVIKDAKEAVKPSGPCDCAKPGIEAVQKSYDSLEEDDWTNAIKVCKDAQKNVEGLKKTCKCPELDSYGKVAVAYENYATATNELDNSEKIDCPKVIKLYEGAIKLLDEAVSKISDDTVKEQIGDIKEYSEEELEYAKDECSSDSEE